MIFRFLEIVDGKSIPPFAVAVSVQRATTAQENFMALLICKNEGESARIVPLGNAILFIGRDPSSGIYIDTSEISRNHASISFVDGKYILRDNGSTNGSFLNGEKIAKGVLAHGDEIRFGPYAFSVDLLARKIANLRSPKSQPTSNAKAMPTAPRSPSRNSKVMKTKV